LVSFRRVELPSTDLPALQDKNGQQVLIDVVISSRNVLKGGFAVIDGRSHLEPAQKELRIYAPTTVRNVTFVALRPDKGPTLRWDEVT
jgi:hypothetical protein